MMCVPPDMVGGERNPKLLSPDVFPFPQHSTGMAFKARKNLLVGALALPWNKALP